RRGQERIILGKRLDPRGPQAAAYPVGNQHALGVSDADPGHPVDQGAKPLEFLVSQLCDVHELSARAGPTRFQIIGFQIPQGPSKRQMADGRWQMANSTWQMADGRWQMADGRS